MRADRLLSALLLLQAKGRLTGRELARRLEVSVRTVHRDMEALGAAGVPVFAVRGSQGGWQLEEGWRTRVPGLEPAELRALLLAQPRVVGDSSLARAAERALDKLMAALPRSLQEQAASMKKRLHVDTTGWSGVPEDLAMLPVVQDAVSRDRRLSLRYWPRGRGVTERVVDPLGLVAKGGTWYLVAHTALGFRTFRVSRIEEARLLDQSFERPPGFDLATYWQASTTELREGRGRYEAVLRLHPDVPAWCQKWRAGALGPPSREEGYLGWVATRVTFDDEAQAVFMALGLGAQAQVLEPPALRRKVRAGHAEALAAQPSDDR